MDSRPPADSGPRPASTSAPTAGLGDGVLITVAPTGAEADPRTPGLPIDLPSLLETAGRCAAAGASVIHVHLRDADGAPTLDRGLAHEAVTALREQTPLIVQLSTGGSVRDSEADRLAVLEALPDAASLTCGTVNFGDEVFVNRWPFIVELYRRMRELGIVPEFECFDLGHLATLRRLLDQEGPPPGGHVHVDLVMGVPGGMDGATRSLVSAVADLPHGATFSATGIGRAALPVAFGALSAGGHLRVGMEDTRWLAPGVPVRHNDELVARAAALAAAAGRPTLSPDDARVLLAIPGRLAVPVR